MNKRPLGSTGFEIAPLVLGGNVFGWTADEPTSFALLDAFVDAGLNAIDTADAYSRWVPGHAGGESETIIGRWLKADPARRDRVLLVTKVGSEMGEGQKGLSPSWIAEAVEDSLRRLGVETIDVYLSHFPDPDTPIADTLGAYARLIETGKIRAIGASNLDASQLAEALRVADAEGLPRYGVLQPHYNLIERDRLEGPLLDLCRAKGLGVISYFGLAKGFLTGKYRSNADLGRSPRGPGLAEYLNPRGLSILGSLDLVARRLNAKPAEVALAWVMAQPGVTAPIASATSLEQMHSLVRATELVLSPEDLGDPRQCQPAPPRPSRSQGQLKEPDLDQAQHLPSLRPWPPAHRDGAAFHRARHHEAVRLSRLRHAARRAVFADRPGRNSRTGRRPADPRRPLHPAGRLPVSGQMAVAYFMAHAPQSLFPVLNGGDAAILFCFVFLYLVFAGPGAFSLDARRAGTVPARDLTRLDYSAARVPKSRAASRRKR